MNQVLYPLCAMLAWLTALYKLRELRRREQDPALAAMCVACTLLAATFTLSTPAIGMSIDWLSGVPNLGTLMAQGCVLLYAASLQALLLLWSYPSAIAYKKIQRRLLAFGTVLAVLVILLLTAPPTEERPTDFVVTYAGEPHYACYFLLYTAAFATSMAEVIRLCLRYAKVCDRPWLRRSLRVTTAGSYAGLLYCAARLADVIGARAGLDPHRWEAVARLGAGGGEILFLIGWTLPSWGPQVTALRDWIGRYRAYQRIFPLWDALYQANPQISLDPPPSRRADLFGLRDLNFRLYRRIIEIQDGRLVLSPYLDPAVAMTARAQAERAGLPERLVQITAEAVLIKTALRRKRQGAVPSAQPLPEASPPVRDPATELAWLVDLAHAFTRTPAATGPAPRSQDQDGSRAPA